VPVISTVHQTANYGGAQATLGMTTIKNNDVEVGVYGFAQHDDEFVSITDTSAPANVTQAQAANGHLEALFLEDQWKALSWLTLTAGVRMTHFSGAVSENAADPRIGAAIRIPHLGWIVRGFYGRYYQAPPLSTV